jgi:heme exporter protein C
VASIAYLVRRTLIWDHRAGAAAEIGVVFTGLALATGSIWGKPVWGVWWTWDARLVLTAVMFFFYLGYLALRRTIDDPERRAQRSAVLGVVGALQIPIVHFSVTWWRGLHQPPTVIRPDGAQLDPPLLFALLMGVVAFTVVFAALMSHRVRLSALEDAGREPARDEATAGTAVVAPRIGDRS